MMKSILLFGVTCLGSTLWISCGGGPDTRTYNVSYQESVALDRYLSLIFYEVAEDSRCPRDAQCIHPGKVEVVMTPLYYDALGPPIHLALDPDTPALSQAIVSEEYRIDLLEVQPRRVRADSIPLDDYQVKIVIEKF